MLKRSILLAGLIFSYPALSASSDYVNSCADFQQQQSNNQITRKQAITLCQCTEERNEKDLEKLQAMNNPTQAQVKKLLEDSARYCLKKAGISQKGSATPKAKPSNNTDDEDDDQPMPSSSSSNGIKIRGIR
ncbi:hypothetical protein [Budvicia aquatica]|uniref:Secreted protein n=1 Tax=Budvicia aquatica TaxID=82979 RepID=A0A2C6DJ24_9GAMM|nr:hypothetical protein [Budvicia aquatica]PHI31226.1 hypothetical protein CRN84_18705 [Budvicia aquatica]GKX52821.1 hypothetical protein SOASR029_31300 [Budvicia aquatica]VFS51500.1 Uncharacterised protein [Budvicia aquatica]